MVTKRRRLILRRIIAVLVFLAGFVAYLIVNPASYLDALKTIVDASQITLKETQTVADSSLARDVLDSLAVKEKYTGEKYYRKLFYDNWGQATDGCNMREAILKRDLIDLVLNGCKVMSGTLADPYTGQTVYFIRGQDTSSAVQIDHVVALSNAWATGAYQLSADQRYDLSQDPLNLIAVDGQANQDKSDQDAADWLPSNRSFQCQYVARQISVKYKYHLWVTPREKAKMIEILAACPEQTTLGLDYRRSPPLPLVELSGLFFAQLNITLLQTASAQASCS